MSDGVFSKFNANTVLFAVVYGLILFALFSPYSFSLTYGKALFAYESIPSNEFNYRFETTRLGFQTIFGVLNLILVIIFTLWMRKSINVGALVLLLIIYLFFVVCSQFLRSWSGIGGPFPDSFLYGRTFLILSTLTLFFLGFRKWSSENKSLDNIEL